MPAISESDIVSIVIEFDEWILRGPCGLPAAMGRIMADCGYPVDDVKASQLAVDFGEMACSVVRDPVAAVASILRDHGFVIDTCPPDPAQQSLLDPLSGTGS